MKNLEKRILVTGGMGFVGSNLVRNLNRKGYKNIVISDEINDSIKWKNLIGLQYNEVVEVDEVAGEFDYIYHLGGESSTKSGFDVVYRKNYEWTMKLINRYIWQRNTKLIIASSGSVYGMYDGIVDENAECRPMSAYGMSKLMTENAVSNTYEKNVLKDRLCFCRFSNVYGMGEMHKVGMMSCASNVLRAYEEGEKTVDVFIGSVMRDFVYVGDVCEWLMDLGVSNDAEYEMLSYNMGSEVSVPWEMIVKYCVDVMNEIIGINGGNGGREMRVHRKMMPEKMRHGYQWHTCMRNSGLRKRLGVGDQESMSTCYQDAIVQFYKEYFRLNEEQTKLLIGGMLV